MKKFFKIACICFIVLLISGFLVEIFIWKMENDYLKRLGVFEKDSEIGFHSGIKLKKYDYKTFGIKGGWGKEPEGLNFKDKKPILIFGNHVAYGFRLDEDKTFTHKLSILSKRTVYNNSFIGWGIQHFLAQTLQEHLYNNIQEPEYVIYVYTPFCLSRLYQYSYAPYNIINEEFDLRYKEYKDMLVPIQNNNVIFNQIKRLYFVNWLQHAYVKHYVKTQNEKANNFALKHFIMAKNEMQKHWKNTKFVVLFYCNEDIGYLEYKLQENGFITIDVNELTDKDLFSEKYYPNGNQSEQAWTLLTPLIIKELGL